MKPETINPRPIIRTAIAAALLFSGLLYVFLGANGRPIVIPPFGVVAIGGIICVSGASAAWLAYWHWRLAAALRGLAESQRRLAQAKSEAGE